MKIQTSIEPRRDGTVIVEGADGQSLTFQPDPETGDLVCDVEDDTAADLLALPGFVLADDVLADTAVKPARGKPGPKPKA
jgi:hypothetical protein